MFVFPNAGGKSGKGKKYKKVRVGKSFRPRMWYTHVRKVPVPRVTYETVHKLPMIRAQISTCDTGSMATVARVHINGNAST